MFARPLGFGKGGVLAMRFFALVGAAVLVLFVVAIVISTIFSQGNRPHTIYNPYATPRLLR
jgi:succinate dehydrogenase hydrophobic anchor subunit